MMDKNLATLLNYMNNKGETSLLQVDNWELPVEVGSEPKYYLTLRYTDYDEYGRSVSEIGVSVWTNATDSVFDIAQGICDELNKATIFNNSGWIERVEIITRPEYLPAPNDRVAGAGFVVSATQK